MTDKMWRVDRNRVAPFSAFSDGWASFVAVAFNLTSFPQIHKALLFAYRDLDKNGAYSGIFSIRCSVKKYE